MKVIKKQLFLNFDPPTEWDTDPILYMIHLLLDKQPVFIEKASVCFPNAGQEEDGVMGRDGMTVEQVVRAAIYKQYKKLTYRDLAEHTVDSIKGRQFMKLGYGQRISFQTLQENIARLSPEVLAEVTTLINQAALELGVDDGQKIRSDATTVETNIHYPTEASLLWDSIRVSCRLIQKVAASPYHFCFRDYRKGAKKLYYQIVNTKDERTKTLLFKQLLKQSQACINQVEATLDRADRLQLPMLKPLFELCLLRSQMTTVHEMTHRHQVKSEKVPVQEKLFSLFEDHTDCIVKGCREAIFGHKINVATGKSNLIFDCVLKLSNWSEARILVPVVERIKTSYDLIPRDVTADGGQAHTATLKDLLDLGVENVVFGKTRGTLQNTASSKHMETRLKRWRSGIEAVISNFKRGLRADRCTWKGWDGFQRFVLLNVAVFNLKIIAKHLLTQL